MAFKGNITPTRVVNDDTISRISIIVSYTDSTWASVSGSIDSNGNVFSKTDAATTEDVGAIIESVFSSIGATVSVPSGSGTGKTVENTNIEVSIQYTKEGESGDKSLNVQYTDEKNIGITFYGDGSWDEAFAAEEESLTSLISAVFPGATIGEENWFAQYFVNSFISSPYDTIIEDESGNGRFAQLRDANCVKNDGNNDYILVPNYNSTDFSNEDWIFSASFVKGPALLSREIILSQELGAGSLRWLGFENGVWYTNMPDGTTSFPLLTKFDEIPIPVVGTFYRLELRKSDTNLTLTLNDNSQTLTGITQLSSTGDFGLCTEYHTLTSEFGCQQLFDVKLEHTNGWHYPFSEGANRFYYDISGNGNHIDITAQNVNFIGEREQTPFFHHNYYYGFTLYTSDTEFDFYVPNDVNNQEVVITPPAGFTRVGNFQPVIGVNRSESTVDFQAWGTPDGLVIPSAYRITDNWEYLVDTFPNHQSNFRIPFP